MNGPDSNPCRYPIRRPSLTSAPAREAARSVAKRHARGVEAGSSRCRSARVGIAASDGMLVARDLGELADAVELVRLGRERRVVVAGALAQLRPRPVDVGADAGDRLRAGPLR